MLTVLDYILEGAGLRVSFNDNTVVQLLYRVVSGQLTITGDLSDAQRVALIAFVDNDVNPLLPQIDARFRKVDVTYKSYTLVTGNPDIYYLAGYYDYPTTSANLSQASLTTVFGSANASYAAHASIVSSGNGTVDTGRVGLRVTGTSIDDNGLRTASDSEILTTDITAPVLDQYLETPKKWIGSVTFELFTVNGSPTTFGFEFNCGLSKYEDFSNINFILTDIECVGRGGSSDTGFDIVLFHHNDQGWTFASTGFVPGGAELARLSTDHGTESNLANNQQFAYKRANLNTYINGAGSEGVVIGVTTASGGSVEIMDAHLGIVS